MRNYLPPTLSQNSSCSTTYLGCSVLSVKEFQRLCSFELMEEPTQSQWTPFDWSEEGEVWMANFRSLRLRMKDRFRVAVDRQRHRRWLADLRYARSADRRYARSCYSTIIRRWVSRIYARPSSHLSIRYRRVPVSEEVNGIRESVILRMLRAVAVPVIGNACYVFMHGFNNVRVYGVEKLHEALLNRSEGKPLLTVSNHVASIDDPFVIASLLPPSVLFDARNLRWTLCATDRCFSNPLMSTFFKCVKVLPVSRGDGVYQKGMDMALSKLNKGGWVHIFPEGTRSRDGGKTLGQPKRGVGRLVMDADDIPLVLPFVHSGMQGIMPIGSSFPKVGKQVTILVGDPILFDDLLLSIDDSQNSRSILYDAASSRIGDHLHALKAELDKLATEQALELDEYSVTNADRANVILHQLDWEAFGMENYMLPEEEHSSFDPEPLLKSTLLHQSDDPNSTEYHLWVNPPNEGGIVSRIHGFMNPTELMGFAVKGLLLDTKKQRHSNFKDVGPVKLWRLYLEENTFGRWYPF